MASSKVSFLNNLQECAHASLMHTHSYIYSQLLEAWKCKEQGDDTKLRQWYIDDRCDPKLFYSLLAYANPEIFGSVYEKTHCCKSLLKNGIDFMYRNYASVIEWKKHEKERQQAAAENAKAATENAKKSDDDSVACPHKYCSHKNCPNIHKSLISGGLTFDVTDTWEQVQQWWDECPEYNDMRTKLDEPSNLTKVDIPRRHFVCPLDIRYSTLDFTGTTVRQAIQKILTFYTHKTYRKEIGDHIFFEGIEYHGVNEPIINLSS